MWTFIVWGVSAATATTAGCVMRRGRQVADRPDPTFEFLVEQIESRSAYRPALRRTAPRSGASLIRSS
jgi:hypothetical protein